MPSKFIILISANKQSFFGGMKMKQFLILVLSLTLIGCGSTIIGKNETAVSHVSQLTAEDHPCKQWSSERVDAVKKRLNPNVLTKWTSEAMLVLVFQAMAGIPDIYLDELNNLNTKHGFNISPGGHGGVALYPQYIQIGNNEDSINLCLQHEVGHITEYFARNDLGSNDPFGYNFYEDLENTAVENHENPNLNAYPGGFAVTSETYKKEYFAEAFNSYYCSEYTNSLLKEQFPSTYEFLLKYLRKPVWQ